MKLAIGLLLALTIVSTAQGGIREAHGGVGLYGSTNTEVLLRELSNKSVACKIMGSPQHFSDTLKSMDKVRSLFKQIPMVSEKKVVTKNLDQLYLEDLLKVGSICLTKAPLNDKNHYQRNEIERRYFWNKKSYKTVSSRIKDKDGVEWIFINEDRWNKLKDQERIAVWLSNIVGELVSVLSPIKYTNGASAIQFLLANKENTLTKEQISYFKTSVFLNATNPEDAFSVSINDVKFNRKHDTDFKIFLGARDDLWAKKFEKSNGYCEIIRPTDIVEKLNFAPLLHKISNAHPDFAQLLNRQLYDKKHQVHFCLTKRDLPIVKGKSEILPFHIKGIQIAVRAKAFDRDIIFIDERYISGKRAKLPKAHLPYLLLHELSQGLIDDDISNRVMRLETLVRGIFDSVDELSFDTIENLLIASKAGEKQLNGLIIEKLKKGHEESALNYINYSWARVKDIIADVYITAGLHQLNKVRESVEAKLLNNQALLNSESIQMSLNRNMHRNYCLNGNEAVVTEFYDKLVKVYPDLLKITQKSPGFKTYKVYGLWPSLVYGSWFKLLKSINLICQKLLMKKMLIILLKVHYMQNPLLGY